MTKKVPASINLNLFMDGINYLYISKVLHSLVNMSEDRASRITQKIGSPTLREIFKEVLHNDFNQNLFPASAQFYDDIIRPTQIFLNHWSAKWDTAGSFMETAISCILSGSRRRLEEFFVRQTGNQNAWEDMFRQPDFIEPEISDERVYISVAKPKVLSNLGNMLLFLRIFEAEEKRKSMDLE